MRLAGKSAIITGAGRGIGKAIAKKFLQEGAKVMICDVNEQRLAAVHSELSAFGEVIYQQANITNRQEVHFLIDESIRLLGAVDILVNNAGIARFESFLDITDDNWNETLGVNLTGAFICSQIAAKQMIRQNKGCIVNMASTNGILGEPGLAHYNASKAGIILLSKSMAIELAPYQIRVNSVCPGFIITDLAMDGGMTEEERQKYKEKIPLNRLGRVEEVANAFAFLASDEASFITGTELVVDGGQISQE